MLFVETSISNVEKLTEMMLMMMLTMIRESRWTGTTLKFGLNIEQSLGAVWWRTTQVIRTPPLPHPDPVIDFSNLAAKII